MNADKDTAPGLVVLWISRDPEAARNMALMYAKNSRLKGWWETVHLIVWGPSAQLLAEVTEFMTLAPGDVLLIGVAYQAPLAGPGSRVRISADGVGSLQFSIAAGIGADKTGEHS